MRTHVDDAPRLSSHRSFTQRRLRFGYKAKRRDNIDFMQLVPNVWRGSHQIIMGDNSTDAGVIDQNVESAPNADCVTDEIYSLRIVG